MSNRNLPCGKVRPARKADLTAICLQIVLNMFILYISQLYRPPRPVTGIALFFMDIYVFYVLLSVCEHI
jgi:hypothetical protein